MNGTGSAGGASSAGGAGSAGGASRISKADAGQASDVTGRRAGVVCEFRPAPGPAVLPLDGIPGAAGSRGTWRLAAAGREWDITLIPLPAPGPCDHRYGTASYRPTETLRHLIQIRDGHCAMPACTRPARDCEWEHALPWPQGPTCTCNGGMHCTKDHRLKEARGWTIKQLPDGRRQWTTPTGLTYTSYHRTYPD